MTTSKQGILAQLKEKVTFCGVELSPAEALSLMEMSVSSGIMQLDAQLTLDDGTTAELILGNKFTQAA